MGNVVAEAANNLGLSPDEQRNFTTAESIFETRVGIVRHNGTTFETPVWRVRHSSALGPAKGGLRYHPEADRNRFENLAFEMMIKTAAADLPYGGGKGGAQVDFKALGFSPQEKAMFDLELGRTLAPVIGPNFDVPAPDVNTNGETMRYLVHGYAQATGQKPEQAYSVTTGKPKDFGGHLAREQATGQGVKHAAVLVTEHVLKQNVKDTTYSIQGFGNVGSFAALGLHKLGGKIVCVSDMHGSIYNPEGIDVAKLFEHAKQTIQNEHGQSEQLGLREFEGFTAGTSDFSLFVECDLLIPAALENVLTEKNAHLAKFKVAVEAGNGPITEEAEKILYRMGKLVYADIWANAGGVIGSYHEQRDNLTGNTTSVDAVLADIFARQSRTFEEMQKIVNERGVTPRVATYEIAIARIFRAMTDKKEKEYTNNLKILYQHSK